ncbi:MAG TPA: DUF6179 domain-containing protein, partial [Bacillota bacterium]|nr:DUF6179 domain-containing protein [Bacillota bacterium]
MDFTPYNPSLLSAENLDYRQLTLSLLKEGLRTGLLSQVKVEQVQLSLMELLSEVILKYTRKESSSVRTETAESLMLSILFSIDFYLRSLPSPTEALRQLQEKQIGQLYRTGLGLVEEEVELTKKLLDEVRKSRMDVPILAYHLTLEDGMDEFFLNYNVKFEAHTIPASLDYPLLCDDMRETGIIYIRNYLEQLLLENRLCSPFTSEYLQQLIMGCGQKFHLKPADLLVNVPELILKNSVTSVLLGYQLDSITIAEEDCSHLTHRLAVIPAEQYPQILGS